MTRSGTISRLGCHRQIVTASASGISDVGIITGDTGEEVQHIVGNGFEWGIRITYIFQDAPRGLAHAVQIAESSIGTDPFLMFLGDNLIRAEVKAIVERFRNNQPNALVLLSEVVEPERFAVAKLADGKLLRLYRRLRCKFEYVSSKTKDRL